MQICCIIVSQGKRNQSLVIGTEVIQQEPRLLSACVIPLAEIAALAPQGCGKMCLGRPHFRAKLSRG